jgi:uncharacterized protein (DUF2062 family)
MPRRFFRKFAFKRHRISEQWLLSPFRHLLHHPAYWGIRRKTVVPGFSLGLFIAFLPFPAHTLTAILLALLLRVNIPATIIGTELSVEWLTHGFLNVWQPLLLGCMLCGALAALIGYVGLDLLWRASLADYVATRRRRKNKR